MKTLFNLLKLIPAFQKLLNEFFESERAELKKQIDFYANLEKAQSKRAREFEDKAAQAQQQITQLRAHIGTLEQVIRDRKAEIEELRNATTKKLQAVDDMDSESVFNTTLYSPRSTPRS